MPQTVLLLSVPSAPSGLEERSYTHPAEAAEAALRLRERCPALAGAIHTNAAGPDASQLLQLAREGQILLSETAASHMPHPAHLQDFGYHRLRNLVDSVRIFALPGSPPDPLKSLDTLPNNLPAQFTSFVGRDRELAEIAALLGSARAVTLTGPGGVGKTRLALQAAAAGLDRYEEGAWFVPLEAVQGPEHLPQAVAAAMGVLGELHDTQADSLLTALRRVVGQRRLLLVLDNCEHLIGDCAVLARRLLVTCPGLRILCTSREPLGVDGEVTRAVSPLVSEAAIQLFAERAHLVQPDFAVTAQNIAAVSEICTRLDGIPLAIELAAARVGVFPPAELAARLKEGFALLSSRSRLAAPRHQTLRAAVAWSHQLLPEPEQMLWRRLSVFAGGFSLEAAMAVAPGSLPHLAVLADKSILRVDRSDDAVRYAMLETIREFGLQQLAAAGEEAAVRRRHLAWYAGWVRDASAKLTGPEQALWFQRLDQEIGNLHAALTWSKSDAESALLGLRLAGDLGYFWMRGRMKEGLDSLSELLALPVLQGAGRDRASALSVAGTLGVHLGQGATARVHLEEGFRLAQELFIPGEQATIHNNLGQLAFHEGRLADALDHYTRSLELFRQRGRTDGVLVNLNNLAFVHLHRGDLATAGALIDEALAGWRGLNYPGWRASALERAAMHRVLTGRLEEARQLLTEALAIAAELQDPELSLNGADRISHWLFAQGQAEGAGQLLRAASALRAAYDLPRPGWEEPLYVRLLDSLGAAAAEPREGQPASLEALWDTAQAWLAAAPGASRTAPAGGLTPREFEVARLVAQGLSDKEVAARLCLSRFTVNNHLRNIYGKLGLTSRAALASWAFANAVAQC